MISGFSKLSIEDKITLLNLDSTTIKLLGDSISKNHNISDIVNQLSENTIGHFPLPFGVVPNVLVNGKYYFLPLVTEESSVVAAIAKAAKIWSAFGGFKTQIIGTKKVGHVHFFWNDYAKLLKNKEADIIEFILFRLSRLNRNMKKRGGGVQSIKLIDCSDKLNNYFQLELSFETIDAMGANFINSSLEEAAKSLKQFVACDNGLNAYSLDINMSILTNFTPDSLVKSSISCKTEELNKYGDSIGVSSYAQKFIQAINIAQVDVNRAVTHNKGIFNGVDALALATGNDWRAIEACGHAYASKSGKYQSLSHAFIEDDVFTFELNLPLAVGTVGGVTNIHPLAKIAMDILGNPAAKELMSFFAVAGLAANFSAINALISSGIQKGHMKMHLKNILLGLNANEKQMTDAEVYFDGKTITHSDVENWLENNSHGE